MATMSRSPPQRRGAERETALHLTRRQGRCRRVQSDLSGAISGASLGMLQAWGSRKGWKPVRAETAVLAPFTTARSPTGEAPNKNNSPIQQRARGDTAGTKKSVIPQGHRAAVAKPQQHLILANVSPAPKPAELPQPVDRL